MSGGVDSSVAAWLLREQGHDVVGVFMRHGQEMQPSPPAPLPKGEGSFCEITSPGKQGCCSAADAADARRVADTLGIPFYAVNFEQEFSRIVDYFTAEYLAGRTPNPCVVCNTWLKFGKLFEYADQLGAEYVATGHYARVQKTPDGETALLRGLDPAKDQSYVLFGIARDLLPRLMFPIGEFCKEEIRKIAEKIGLQVAAKRDSQEICFVPDQDHARFIRQRCGLLNTAGEIVLTDGTVVGRHDGFERFTIGQRKGLKVAFGQPRYVVRLEADTHRVVIGTHEELARRELFARGANWLVNSGQWSVVSGQKREGLGIRDWGLEAEAGDWRLETGKSNLQSRIPNPSFPATVKIRYRSQPAEALITLLPDDRFHVQFAEPCYGVAPGQAAVCYAGDRVLGGGWIE
jgi:tRNA-specific 2-thiouridylase